MCAIVYAVWCAVIHVIKRNEMNAIFYSFLKFTTLFCCWISFSAVSFHSLMTSSKMNYPSFILSDVMRVPFPEKLQVTNIDFDYKLKKFMHLIGFSPSKDLQKSHHRSDASISTPKYVHSENMVYLKQHLKVLCCYCQRDDRIQPIAIETDSIGIV